MRSSHCLLVIGLLLGSFGCASSKEEPRLTTLALRVHDLPAMVRFYRGVFGFRFTQVETSGIQSQFGVRNDLTIKLVPLRALPDFEGFPTHQPGFEVEDVRATLRLAIKHGGKQEGGLIEEDDQLRAAMRDPDGNTIEIYSDR
ncbi:MAG: VOC family protein [Planctomycetota bacterium]